MTLVRLRERRDTAANWTSANPILGLGEKGLETDTGREKVGDGVTVWNTLGYVGGAGGLAAWAPNHSFTASQVAVAPDGAIIQSNTTRTSRPTYDPTEQSKWTTITSDTLFIKPSGDTTGAADTTVIVSALAAIGFAAGITRASASPVAVVLSTSAQWYINANQITIKPGQAFLMRGRGAGQINCVGGSSGQVFLNVQDTGFSLAGTDLASRGPIVGHFYLDGKLANGGTIAMRAGDHQNSDIQVEISNFGGILGATVGSTTNRTVNGRSDSTTTVSGSQWVTDASVAIADLGHAVSGTGIPSGALITGLVRGSLFQMGYAAPAVANATATGTNQTIQVGWGRTSAVATLTSGSNFVGDVNATAADLGATVFSAPGNLPIGCVVIAVDPGVGIYLGTPTIGFLGKNTNYWCEKVKWYVEGFNNHQHMVLDGGGAFNSFSYDEIRLTVNLQDNQAGLVFRNGLTTFGQEIRLQGNHTPRMTSNNNAVMIQQSEASTFHGDMRCQVEMANVSGAQGAVPHFISTSSGSFGGAPSFYGSGKMMFVSVSPAPAWQASKVGTASLNLGATVLGFWGFIGGVWGVNSGYGFGSWPRFTTSGPHAEAPGVLTISGTSITVLEETGNIFKGQLAGSTAYTVAFNTTPAYGASAAVKLELIIQQVGSGTASTIPTWPASVVWSGTATPSTPPAMNSTLNGYTRYTLITWNGGTTWVGSAA